MCPLNGDKQMTPSVFSHLYLDMPTSMEGYQVVLMLGSIPDVMRNSIITASHFNLMS